MKKIVSALLASFILAPVVNAAEVDARRFDAYYQAGNVSVTEELPTAGEIANTFLEVAPPATIPAGETIGGIWDKIVNGDWNTIVLIGEKILEIVKANQPVVNVKRDVVHAVPAGVTSWQELAGWKAPMTKVYRIKIDNLYGINVVDVRVKVSAMWGGNAGGRGAYLSNVVTVPSNVYVAWGWTLDLWSENRDPVNAGSYEYPVAGLGFDIRYRAKTMLNDLQGTQDYYLTGDGQIQVLE